MRLTECKSLFGQGKKERQVTLPYAFVHFPQDQRVIMGLSEHQRVALSDRSVMVWLKGHKNRTFDWGGLSHSTGRQWKSRYTDPSPVRNLWVLQKWLKTLTNLNVCEKEEVTASAPKMLSGKR